MKKNSKIVEPPEESLVADVPCELVQLELADGYVGVGRLFVGEVGPDISNGGNDKERGVLYLHGIQSHGGWFLRSCDYLRQKGMIVLAPERRGSGLNEKERGHCSSAKQLIEDTDRCVEWLLDYGRRMRGVEAYPTREPRGVKPHPTKEEKKAPDPFFKVDIVAVSWSGKLALAYAAQFPQKVRSVVLVTPGLKAKIDISLKEKIVIGVHGIVSPHKPHEIPLNEPELFTANPGKIKFLENDPLKLTHATASFFVTSKHLDLQVPKPLSKLTMPVYLLLAEHDKIIDNDATITLLRNVLQPIDKSGDLVKIYRGAHHTLDFELGPQEYFEDLVRILRKS